MVEGVPLVGVPLVGGPHDGKMVLVLGRQVVCHCHPEGTYQWNFLAGNIVAAKWKRHTPLRAKPMKDACKWQYGIATSDGYIPPPCGECHECTCPHKARMHELEHKLGFADALFTAIYDLTDPDTSRKPLPLITIRTAIRELRPRLQ